MNAEQASLLTRIAEALERLAPPAAAAPSFEGARLFRHEPAGGFTAAPDFPLPLDLLVGIERQKARFVENLTRFANGMPSNHALLWGVRGTGKKQEIVDVGAFIDRVRGEIGSRSLTPSATGH